MMKIGVLLLISVIKMANSINFISTSTSISGSNVFVGGHQINVITEPKPKLYVDGELVNLTTAGSNETGPDYVYYSDFPNLPGLSVRFYNDGGYSVYYENNGVVSKFGTLSKEEQQALNDQLNKTFENVNNQVAQIQNQVGNMMQSLTNMFNQPGWPFTG